jgi:signal peptidase I
MRILAGATLALRRIVDIGLVALILVALLGILLGRGAPLVGLQSIVIGGGSMEPALGLGSAIIVKPVDPAALAVDDVVSMQIGPERTTYTHRIVAVVDRADGRWIRTKGDANPAPDPTLVSASAVIGRVEFVIPLAGYLLALLSLPMGVMFVIGMAATLLAVAWLLESLEPEPRPARSAGAGAFDRSRLSATIGATNLSLADPEVLSGEPIAARPVRAPVAGVVAAWTAASPFATPLAASGAGVIGRPTVRDQIDRSREVRRRRARWLTGRGNDRSAAD